MAKHGISFHQCRKVHVRIDGNALLRISMPPVSLLFHVTYFAFDFSACGIQQILTGESIARQMWKSERPLLGRGQLYVIARPQIDVLRTNELSDAALPNPRMPLWTPTALNLWSSEQPKKCRIGWCRNRNEGSSKWQLAT